MSAAHRAVGDIQGALDAYDAAPQLMVAYDGPDLRLTSANAAARAALAGRGGFGTPALHFTPALGDGRTIEVLERVFTTGECISAPAWPLSVLDRDGQRVEMLCDVTLSPWFAEDGSVRGVLAHGTDVTDATRDREDDRGPEQAPPTQPSATQTTEVLQRYDTLTSVMTMQDALLPEWLPVLPGVELAGRYLLAQSQGAAGGDWFDAVALGDGRVALVVGDVAGHGVTAAAVMGQLRTVAHERLLNGADLAETMRALDVFARSLPDARATTVCVTLLDTRTGDVEYCTAGHPPPLVVSAEGGRPRFLPHSGAAGLATSGQLRTARDRVHRGDLLLLYSDGLVQRPGCNVVRSTVELGEIAAEAAAGAPRTVNAAAPGAVGAAERVCEQTLERVVRQTGYGDDVTLLVAELTGIPQPLHLDLAVDDSAISEVLDAVGAWLDLLRVRDLDHLVVQHAVDELVANVVDHAYSHPGATSSPRMTVDAELLSSGDLEIRFGDSGRWRAAPPDEDEGRGLMIVNRMVDRLLVEGSDQGTLATIRHRLSRPARMLTGEDTWPGHRQTGEAGTPFTITARGGTRLEVCGSVDRDHQDELRSALAGRIRHDRVVLDLTGVTHLPSSAVQTLYAALRSALDRGQRLLIYAPPATPAQHVLELVQLPYELTDPDGA